MRIRFCLLAIWLPKGKEESKIAIFSCEQSPTAIHFNLNDFFLIFRPFNRLFLFYFLFALVLLICEQNIAHRFTRATIFFLNKKTSKQIRRKNQMTIERLSNDVKYKCLQCLNSFCLCSLQCMEKLLQESITHTQLLYMYLYSTLPPPLWITFSSMREEKRKNLRTKKNASLRFAFDLFYMFAETCTKSN